MKNKILLFTLLLLTLFFLLPQLQIPWMIVDDGESARASLELTEHFKKADVSWLFKFEAQNGLLRPTYWLLHWLNFSIFGMNAFLHHFGHLFLFLAISALLFLLVEEISSDGFAGLLSGIFLLLFFPAAENLYRLGTGEPGLTLALLGVLYFIVKAIRRNSCPLFYLSLIFLIFAWFAKATVIVLIPVAFFIFLIFLIFREKKYPHALRFCFAFFLANLILFLVVRSVMVFWQIRGGYASQYELDPVAFWSRLNYYSNMIRKTFGFLIYFILISFFWRILSAFKKRSLSWAGKWELIMFSFFVFFLAVQLPWPHLMGRYLPPALIGLVIVFGMELSFLLKKGVELINKKRLLLASFFLLSLGLSFLYFLFGNSGAIIKRYQEVIPTEKRRAEVVFFLAQNTPEKGRVFYNFSDGLVEFLYEMGLHFKIFHHRPDIQTAYLFLDNGFHFKKGDIIVTGPPFSHRYPWEEVRAVFKTTQDLKIFDRGWEIIELLEDEEIPPVAFATKVEERINLLKEGFSFVDGDEPVRISAEKLPLDSGKLEFIWQPPKDIIRLEKKMSLIRQGERGEFLPNGILVWAEKNRLVFSTYDPWRGKRQVLSVKQEFSSKERYEIILGWGRAGMTLEMGENYLFLPYYAGINPHEDLILGPILPENPEFEEVSGTINEVKLFTY